jgi:hypothetical protein
MSPSHWGPPTWMFIHTLAEKVKEEEFPKIGHQIISNIQQICYNLPCPDCADHSRTFWSKVKVGNIQSKTDLINLLYVFHNCINKRKKLGPFKYENLAFYRSQNIVTTFNNFARNFNTKGNMKLLTESFHRGRLITSLKSWMMANINSFDP